MKLGLGLTLINSKFRNNGVAYSTQLQNVLDYATDQSLPFPTIQTLSKLDTSISQKVVNGVLGKCDFNYTFAQDFHISETNFGFTLINIADPGLFTAVVVGSPTFTRNKGWNSLANSSNYIDTGFTPSEDAVNMTLDNGCIFCWSYESPVVSGVIQCFMGGGTNHRIDAVGVTTANTIYAVNSATSSLRTASLAAGLYLANRASSANEQLYVNGAQVDTENDASGSLDGSATCICSRASGALPYNGHISEAGSSSSLAAEQSGLYDIVSNYMA